jgi:hypothetical protein
MLDATPREGPQCKAPVGLRVLLALAAENEKDPLCREVYRSFLTAGEAGDVTAAPPPFEERGSE